MQIFKDLYLTDGVLNQNRITVLLKGKAFNFYEPIAFLAGQFFEINYLHTSKNTIFLDNRSNIDGYVPNHNYCDEH